MFAVSPICSLLLLTPISSLLLLTPHLEFVDADPDFWSLLLLTPIFGACCFCC